MVYMVYMVVRAQFQACVSFFPTVFISVWQKDVNLEFSPVSSPSVLLVLMPSENKPPTSFPCTNVLPQPQDLQFSTSTLQLFSYCHGFSRLSCHSTLTSFFQRQVKQNHLLLSHLVSKGEKKGLREIIASLYFLIYLYIFFLHLQQENGI